MVMSLSFFIFTITSSMFCVDIGSNALVGSSSNKTFEEKRRGYEIEIAERFNILAYNNNNNNLAQTLEVLVLVVH